MGVYFNVQQSLLAYCKDFLTRNSISDFDVFDFDVHGVLNDLPNKDLIGIAEFGIENSQETYISTCMIVVSTKADDKDLTRLRNVIDKLFEELKPGYKGISVKNASTGNVLGNMTVMDDVGALAVARTATRPVQMIAIQLGSSFLVPP